MKSLKLFNGNGIFVAISMLFGVATILLSSSLCWLFLLYLLFLSSKKSPFIIILCLCFFTLGMMWTSIQEQRHQTIYKGKETQFVGLVVKDLRINGNFLSFVFQSEQGEKVALQYTISSLEEKQELQKLRYGDFVKVTGELEVPKGQRVKNGFDYQMYLKKDQIHWVLKAENLLFQPSDSYSFLQALQNKRLQNLMEIELTYSPRTASFIQALVFGEQGQIDENIQKQYEKFGLSHLLAISGSHFTLLISSVSLILWRLGVSREKTCLLVLICIPVYAIIAGGEPSVVRAAITGSIVVCCLFFGMKVMALDLLSGVFIFLLLLKPTYLFEVGFQLSFLVSGALLLSSAKILKNHSSFLSVTFFVTVVAQVSSLPIIFTYFYEISPYSLLLNVVFIPFLSFLVLPLCIGAVLFSIGITAKLFDNLIGSFLALSEWLLKIVEPLPFGELCVGRVSGFSAIVVVVVIFIFFVLWEQEKGKQSMVVLGGMLVLLFMMPFFHSEGTVTLLDVGQGDCIVIELPYRKGVYVIDTGGMLPFEKEEWEVGTTKGVGERVVVPFLKSKGIRTIDKLVFTHGDYDHIGESRQLFENFQVKELLIGKKATRTALEKEMIVLAYEKGITLFECESGMKWEEGGFSFQIMTPYEQYGEENNQSIVIYAHLGGAGFLFTGDLEEEGEKWLVENYPTTKIDVVKVGHHGSKSSTSQLFLDAYQPSMYLISAGVNNRYGHPHQEVLDRIKAKKGRILRTDKHGSITFTFTKTDLEYEVMIKEGSFLRGRN